MKESIRLALILLFLIPTWVKADCNSVYTLPINEWHLISLPCDPGNDNSVADIFGDDIEGELTDIWAIFKFNTNTQSYDSLSSTDVLEQGQGYWIISANESVELDMPTTSSATPVSQCSSENGCFDIPLHSSPNSVQWSLLGFPFTSNQAWNTSQIVTNDSCSSPACSVSEASSDDKNILNQQIWKYVVDEGYVVIDNAKELTPWSGFWAVTLENAFSEGQAQLLISSPIDNNQEIVHNIASIEEASGISYSQQSNTFIVASDRGDFYEISPDGSIISSHDLGNYDLEGVVAENDRLVFAVEDGALIIVDRQNLTSKKLDVDVDSVGINLSSRGFEGIAKVGELYYLSVQVKKERDAKIVVVRLSENSTEIVKVIEHGIIDSAGMEYHNGKLYIISDKKNTLYVYDLEANKVVRAVSLPEFAQEGITFGNRNDVYFADDNGSVMRYRLSDLGL